MESHKTFIASDIVILDLDQMDHNRYDYTWDRGAFLEYLEAEYDHFDSNNNNLLRESLTNKYPTAYERWQNSTDEYYEIPMMNALYYYPDFVSFEEIERYKTIGSTTLLYDTHLDRWAVGMTGGGMDLSPDLLATFITLDRGVPVNIAQGIIRRYCGNIDPGAHQENCNRLAEAMKQEAFRWDNTANSLNQELSTTPSPRA